MSDEEHWPKWPTKDVTDRLVHDAGNDNVRFHPAEATVRRLESEFTRVRAEYINCLNRLPATDGRIRMLLSSLELSLAEDTENVSQQSVSEIEGLLNREQNALSVHDALVALSDKGYTYEAAILAKHLADKPAMHTCIENRRKVLAAPASTAILTPQERKFEYMQLIGMIKNSEEDESRYLPELRAIAAGEKWPELTALCVIAGRDKDERQRTIMSFWTDIAVGGDTSSDLLFAALLLSHGINKPRNILNAIADKAAGVNFTQLQHKMLEHPFGPTTYLDPAMSPDGEPQNLDQPGTWKKMQAQIASYIQQSKSDKDMGKIYWQQLFQSAYWLSRKI